jgi:predicted GH43/DUF377 family glycosyl hydrolase
MVRFSEEYKMKVKLIQKIGITVMSLLILGCSFFQIPTAAEFEEFIEALAGGSEPDITPPADVTNLSVEIDYEQLTLSWSNPADEDFAGVKIICNEENIPVDATDGTEIYSGADGSFIHEDLIGMEDYFYKVFAFDDSENTTEGIETEATPLQPLPSETWTKYAGNPVLNPGAAAWENDDVTYPSVLYTEGEFHMWYSGRPTGGSQQIGYATSSDGITWTKYGGNPVIETGAVSQWDENGARSSTVIYESGLYKMWYTGDDDIGYATSTDGKNWTKYSGNPVLLRGLASSWDDDDVCYPAVIKVGEIYHMFYTGITGSTWRLGHAESTDGINWEKYSSNPVVSGDTGEWDESGMSSPVVSYINDKFYMWYCGATTPTTARIGHAVSTDGTSWTKSENNPVIGYGIGGAWDDQSLSPSEVIYKNGQYYIWFNGWGGAGTFLKIGLATAPAIRP